MTVRANVTVTPIAPSDGQQDWWTSVTPMELRRAPEVVVAFLEGRANASVEDVEEFARALALRQLLHEDGAVINAASDAYNLMPPEPRGSAEGLAQAEAWLPRGVAIEHGLVRTLELLLPRDEGRWHAAVNHFKLGLHLFRSSCVTAAVHAGLREAVAVKPPLKLKRRDI